MSKSAVLGETSASGEAEGSFLLYFVGILVLLNACVRYVLRVWFYIVDCSSTRDFLAKAKKRATTSADCDIIDVEPLSFKVLEKVDKGKAVAMVPQKRKGNIALGSREKLMKDVFHARTGGEGLKTSVEPVGDAGTGGRFMSTWRLRRDTNIATVVEKQEWATFALPPRVRAGFSKNIDREIVARSNAEVVEVSL